MSDADALLQKIQQDIATLTSRIGRMEEDTGSIVTVQGRTLTSLNELQTSVLKVREALQKVREVRMSDEFDDEDFPTVPHLQAVENFLPGTSPIKDDLQAIYEAEKEIGSAVFRLHKLIRTMRTEGHEQIEELEEHLGTLTEGVAANHLNLRALLNEADWQRMRIAAEVTLRANGIDPRTLAEQPEATKKLAKWMSAIQIIAIGVLTTILSAWIMSSFSKSLLSDQQTANAELVKEVKKVIGIVQTQQEELTAHIERDKKASKK